MMKGNYEKQREENSHMIKLYASKINCLDNYYVSILVIFYKFNNKKIFIF